MRKVKLSEVCDISSGGTPPRNKPEYFKGDIPWVKISDIENADNGVVYETEEYISIDGLKSIRGKLFPKGTLLFAMYGSIGKVGICGRELSTNQAILGIRPRRNDEINLNYLKAWFASNKQKLINQGRGVALKNLSATIVRNLEIEFPPLDDQIRIAHLLGKVEELIASRKQHLQQRDELVKSVFLEMFGDPVRNEKGWEKLPLARLGALNRGVSKHRPRNAPELLDGKYPLIQTGEVSNAGTYITNFSNTYSELGLAQSKMWPSGTLCITIAANIAQTAILTFDSCFPDSIVAFSAFEKEAHVLYVHGLFCFFQKILEKNAPAAAQKNINLEILRNLQVPKPPFDLQEKFAVIVEKIESIKIRYQQSLSDLEALYGALSQKAFKGELDLSRVPLPIIEPEEEQAVLGQVIPDAPEKECAFELPDIDHLPTALDNTEARKAVLIQWLKAYCDQLGSTPFSLQHLIAAAQNRLTDMLRVIIEDETTAEGYKARLNELYPSDEVKLDANDYDYIKGWVFKALKEGTLTQALNDAGHCVQLEPEAVPT